MFLGIDFLKLATNPRNWLNLAILVAVLYVGYIGYNWIYDRGAASRNQEITDLTKARDKAVSDYTRYKGEYDTWVENTKKAQEDLLAAQKTDLDARQARLEQAERDARNKPTAIKEVIKYVPAQVDATYRLPAGFVRLYADTLEGRPSPFSASGQVSGSQPFDVGEPSGIALSQFGQIAASNNAECVLRGKVIEEWQGWYRTNKPAYDKLIEWMKTYGPKSPNGDTVPSTAIEPAPAH